MKYIGAAISLYTFPSSAGPTVLQEQSHLQFKTALGCFPSTTFLLMELTSFPLESRLNQDSHHFSILSSLGPLNVLTMLLTMLYLVFILNMHTALRSMVEL